MSPLELVRTRTIDNPLTKVCMGELGCRRPVRPSVGLCRLHQTRKARQGTTTAQHPLRRRQRRPYVQAAFSWFKERMRAKDTAVLQTLSEFDSFLRRCEHIHASDLGRRRVNSHRKMQGILYNVLKRWPDGHQAAVAILSVILASRLACAHEPGVAVRHPAFVRAMQVHAVYSLVRRKNMKTWKTHRPQLGGRWLAKRLDDAVSPFIKFMCPSKERDREILGKVLSHQYIKVRWESLARQIITTPNKKPTRKGHPCPWRGKTAPQKGDRYHVHL